jgi:hypothetical protein
VRSMAAPSLRISSPKPVQTEYSANMTFIGTR